MHNSEGFGSLTPHLELHWVEEKIFILKKRTLQSLKRKEKEDLINWSDPCLCKILYSGVWRSFVCRRRVKLLLSVKNVFALVPRKHGHRSKEI